MVAITVILAAVIGAFVLEIGDQQETAPSTSFDSEEFSVSFRWFRGSGFNERVNDQIVAITIAGGENLPVSQTDVKVNGNRSVVSVPLSGQQPVQEANSDIPRDEPKAELAPPRCETVGDNEEVSLTSGESMNVITYGGSLLESLRSDSYSQLPAPENVDCSGERTIYHRFGTGSNAKGPILKTAVTSTAGGNEVGMSNPLCSDDTVNVVWEASSGGKTQNLFKYTVQSSSDWCP